MVVGHFDWEISYNAEEYLRLFDMFSGHMAMEAWQQDCLYAEIRRRLAERSDGRLRRHWGAVLRVARRADPTPASSADRFQALRALNYTSYGANLVAPAVLSFLHSPDVVGRLADALNQAWSVLIAPDWPQLRTRTGWAGAMDGMHPAVAWDTGGPRISNRPPLRAVLDGRGLLFVPSVFIYPDSASASTHPASTTHWTVRRGNASARSADISASSSTPGCSPAHDRDAPSSINGHPSPHWPSDVPRWPIADR